MGSILSRVDPRHANDDDDNDDISLAGVGEVVSTVVAAGSSRGAGVSSSSSSFDSRKKSGDSKRRSSVESSENKSLSSDSTAPSKEKRKALSLIKNPPPDSSKSKGSNRGSRGRTLQRGNSSVNRNRQHIMKTNDNRNSSSKTKENDARTMIATQSRQPHHGSGHNVRMPLDSIAEKQNQVQPKKVPCASKKKLRQASYNFRRNGSKSSSVTSKDKAAAAANGLKSNPTMKVPIDPPGAILGALPWMHHSNSQHQLVPSAAGTTNGGGHFYGGGGGHPTFQPVFPPMNNWGYQPSHHHQQVVPNNVDNRSQQWTVPPFLAPFANFMTNNGNHHDHTWVSNSAGANNHFSHMVHNASNTQHNSHVERGNVKQTNGAPPPPPSEAEDVMSVDESMASAEEVADETPPRTPDIKEVETKFILSTFAPPEYVEEIKARNEAAAKANNAIQTRSMTAKKNRAERRDGTLRSSSANNNSSKSKTNATAAHQACSPRSDVSRGGKGSGSKVEDADVMSDSIDSPAPQVMTILGKRVTMIDPVRKVFVIDLLSPEQCDQIRMMADNHTREIHKSGSNAGTWRTLYTYTKMDLPVVEVKDMVKHTDNIMHHVKKIVGEIFGMKKEAMKLRPRSWKEPHLLLYQALKGRESHTGIEMHYDGCDITWQAVLTRLDEYEGGGTYFRCLRKTVKLQQGQVLVHPGELYHKGIDITYGVRCLLVCFTDGMNPKILDDSKADEHKEEYEKNVRIY